MGKFFKFLIGIVTILAIGYILISGKLATFVDLISSANDKFIYSKDFIVNSLQRENSDYYYNFLTDNQKKIYSAVARGVNKLDRNILVSKYEIADVDSASNDAKEAINAFLSDHPEVFYMNSQYTISITESILGKTLKLELSYRVTGIDDLNNQINVISKGLHDIVDQVMDKSDYEKELFIHDYLAKHVKYYSDFEDEDSILDKYHTVYSAIVDKEAVCDGISKTYQLLLGMVGIESQLVTGHLSNTPHAWNIVNVDGNWLHVDITSDKYIKDEDDNTIEAVHTYFNVNTEFITNTHKIEKVDIVPESTSLDYTYYVKNGSYIKIDESFENRVKEIVNIQKDRKVLEFATDYKVNVPERLLKQLYNVNFNNLKSGGNNVTMEYYSEQNVYIVKKN